MKLRHVFRSCLIGALATVVNIGTDRMVSAQQAESAPVAGIEILTRGPVHEAFAETVAFDPQPGIVVPKAPPEAIEEVPPNQKPEGTNVVWIPGYWAWDDERDDFLWVSGIWRAVPPGRQWVPGYWAQSGENSQWISGYWADASLNEIQYLPEPPATVEAGPSSAAPSADHIWIPGTWVWYQERFAWRPGYWVVAHPQWTWVPAHYVWSPRGYVFVDDYYDYDVARRGVLFAPVYFSSNVYSRQGFTYSPMIAISIAVFGNQLFLRPDYGHYYFGDYYGSQYTSGGFYPWFSFYSGGYGYDPFYAHQAWHNRRDPAWAKSVQTDFQNRVAHEDARPPRTFADQQARISRGDQPDERNLAVALPLDKLAATKESTLRFQPVTKDEQQSLTKHGQAVSQFRAERQKLEAARSSQPADQPARATGPARMKLPKSPIVGEVSEQPGKDQAPPKRPEAPAADPKVEPGKIKAGKPALPSERPKADPQAPPKREKPGLEPRPAPRLEPKPAPGTEPRPAPKVEPKPAPRPEPKPAPRVEPKPAPRPEPKPAPRVEPKPAPRPEPKPAPRVEPQPAPKPAPRVEPKPAPRAEPRPEPKAGPKPAPRGEPKPAPRGEPKEKGPKQ